MKIFPFILIFILVISIGCEKIKPIAPILNTPTKNDYSITLSWSPVKSATIYKVYYAEKTTKCSTYSNKTTTMTSIILSPLKGGTTYCVYVTAIADFESEPSSSVQVKTNKGSIPVQPTMNPKYIILEKYFKISWNSVANALSYKIYKDDGILCDQFQFPLIYYDSTSNNYYQFLIQKEDISIGFCFSVQAVNNYGESSGTNKYQITHFQFDLNQKK